MGRISTWGILMVAALWIAPLDASADNAKSIALFETHFNDTSTEGQMNGVREDETARLALFDKTLREKLIEAGYELVPLDAVADDLERIANPANCNGCAVRMGEDLGADLVFTSEVQKVSNLILAFNLAVYDVASGKLIRIGSADIRGNNDTSWLRGQRWLLKNRILKEKP